MDPRVMIYVGVIVAGVGRLVIGVASRSAAAYLGEKRIRPARAGRVAIIRRYQEVQLAEGRSARAATAFLVGLVLVVAGLVAIGVGIVRL